MKIAFDISPIANSSTSGHKVRGVGMYIQNLKDNLLAYDTKNAYDFFTEKNAIPKNVQLIHFPYFDPFFLTLPLRKKAKIIVTVHDLTPLVFPNAFPSGIKGSIRWQMQKFLLKHTDRIIADSYASKKDIVRIAHIPPEKVDVIYLAPNAAFKQLQVSKSQKQFLREKYKLPEKFLLYVGDVTWNKNLPRLLEAIEKIDIPLVMVGKALVDEIENKDNPWNKDAVFVQNTAVRNPQIIRLGFLPVEDLVSMYNIATAFIMPSLYEGFGLPVIEAMACGTPVITSKEGSLPEVAGESAYYVDAYSAESIRKGILTVWENSSLRNELSKKGLVQAKKFSWEQVAKQTIAAYEKTI